MRDRLAPEILAAIPDSDLESVLYRYVAAQVERLGNETLALATLPKPLRTWYLAFLVDVEVLNGGFNQLFYNANASVAAGADTVRAFEDIGLTETASIMKRALTIARDQEPLLEAARKSGTMEDFMDTYEEDPFSDLDEEYSMRQEEVELHRIPAKERRVHSPSVTQMQFGDPRNPHTFFLRRPTLGETVSRDLPVDDLDEPSHTSQLVASRRPEDAQSLR